MASSQANTRNVGAAASESGQHEREKDCLARAPIVLVVMDGLAGESSEQLGYRTCLEASRTETLDAMAASGWLGQLDPYAPGIACGSDTAHMSLLGYDPSVHYTGRGPLEAEGCGLNVPEGGIAFKCVFAEMEESDTVISRAAGGAHEASRDASLLDGMKLPQGSVMRVTHAGAHRAAAVLEGEGLAAEVSGTDPRECGQQIQTPKPVDGSNERQVKAANELSAAAARAKELLPGRRTLLFRGAGHAPSLVPFCAKWGFRRGVFVGATRVVEGVARRAGLETIRPLGATGDWSTDEFAKASAASNATNEGADFVLLHVKMTDDASHSRDPHLKAAAITRCDGMMRELIQQLPPDAVVCCLGDHATSPCLGDHSPDPVPVVMASAGQVGGCAHGVPKHSSSLPFSEPASAHGSLGRFSGISLMPTVLSYARRLWE